MLSPVVLGLSDAIHVYVELTLLVNGIVAVPPLQIVVPDVVIIGVGITLTDTVCGIPAQVPLIKEGVTVYVTI